MPAAPMTWQANFVKTGAPIGLDASPLVDDPDDLASQAALGTAQPFTSEIHSLQAGGGGSRMGFVSVTGGCTIAVWVKANSTWLPVKSAVAVTATDFVFVDLPPGGRIFVQVTANAGGATVLYGGYM
jgi:hypothetical protein